MFKYFLLLFLPFAFQLADNTLKPLEGDDIKGTWFTADNEAVVEVYENKGLYYGKIISLAKPLDKKGEPKKDKRNKDPRLRERPMLGINTLYNLKFNSHEQHWEGKVYIPLTGMEVDAIITLKNENTMLIRGSLGTLRKTQVWARVNKL